MIITTENITPYDPGLPMPGSASGQTDYGQRRSNVRGFPDQGQFYGSNPTTLPLTFDMDAGVFAFWSRWMQDNAIDSWIELPVPSNSDTLGGTKPLLRTIVRLVSYRQEILGGTYLRISANFDQWPEDVGDAVWGVGGDVSPPLEIGDWIVAGDPANPSSPDWIVAGNPALPSPDTIDSQGPKEHEENAP